MVGGALIVVSNNLPRIVDSEGASTRGTWKVDARKRCSIKLEAMIGPGAVHIDAHGHPGAVESLDIGTGGARKVDGGECRASLGRRANQHHRKHAERRKGDHRFTRFSCFIYPPRINKAQALVSRFSIRAHSYHPHTRSARPTH